MAKRFSKGDKVEWETSQGTTSGKVVKRVTKPTKVKGYRAKAAPDDPQYLVESDKSGAQAVHRPEALKKRWGGRCRRGRSSAFAGRIKSAVRPRAAPGCAW